MYEIPFNSPYFTGNELVYLQDAQKRGRLSSNGEYTRKCQHFFESRYGFERVFLTHSCTQALEMAALVLDLGPGDEVILPSYAYVSTANAFALRGCSLVFADSRPDFPAIDETKIEDLISPRTRALVIVHYGGMSCNMEKIIELSIKHDIYLIEDAAAAIDAYYLDSNGEEIPLGSMGHMATFSFHETKNISCGEGGMLVLNDVSFIDRAEHIWSRGTNRKSYERGLSAAYQWVSIGSAFAPSEINAAWLWAQLEQIEHIKNKRKIIWDWYDEHLEALFENFGIKRPTIPEFVRQNYHLYYLTCTGLEQRQDLIEFLQSRGVLAVFHYQCLHLSPFFREQYQGEPLYEAEKFQNTLLRLPLFVDLDRNQLQGLIQGGK
ncbi:dTDP-4-amino-4,6-dideoxygalactose transaminase [Cyclobacterium lianum]|uniref:dTDP-4-amino-4,6-dideoxygalactose transaminase n=1 Tax=Cyclobacterium lianum TaxID=388280 RepID=A0A1M7Q2Y8_9BACT|nr:dTDP-4-amino-4,6-dideoxygalactose transaminase [Cyclobacterium lianum]SHN24656.1 dTDP-4-amino-4,6-dideoxygalactose transaminase [Cyclobacterium lianum]